MKITCYLILNEYGAVSVRKNKPPLSSDEVAVKLNLSLSDKFFERFMPEVDIKVPDDYVMKPSIDVKLKGGAMDKLLGKDKDK